MKGSHLHHSTISGAENNHAMETGIKCVNVHELTAIPPLPNIDEAYWGQLDPTIRAIVMSTLIAIISRVPVLIVGPPGSGKTMVSTAMLSEYLRECPGKLFSMAASSVTPPTKVMAAVDLPSLVEGEVRFTTKGTILDPDNRAVIVDELTRGNIAFLHALSNFLSGGTRRVPPPFIGTANFGFEDAFANPAEREQLEAIARRFATFEIPKSVPTFAGNRGFNARVAAAREIACMSTGSFARGDEFPASVLKVPTFHEMRAVAGCVQETSGLKLSPPVTNALERLLRSMRERQINADERLVTYLMNIVASTWAVNTFRSANPKQWQSAYDAPHNPETKWGHYAEHVVLGDEVTHITPLGAWGVYIAMRTLASRRDPQRDLATIAAEVGQCLLPVTEITAPATKRANRSVR